MALQKIDKPQGFFGWFRKLSKSKKVIFVVMSIWAAQAAPKWTAAITADDEFSATIMKTFIAPRGIN
jgi:hypothetical protein